MTAIRPLRTLHLFAGAGGGLLADLVLGHQPIAAVENNPYCCAVLRERSEDGWFPGLRVHECDVREFDPSEYAVRVDCIAAGFPCQDISAAGQRRGIHGARSGLWREVARAVAAIQPAFVFLENSPRIVGFARATVLAEFVSQGYAWNDGLLAAADVGAGHSRDRWWCLLANADGLRQLEQRRQQPDQRGWAGNGPREDADLARVGRTEGRPELNPRQRDAIASGSDSQASDPGSVGPPGERPREGISRQGRRGTPGGRPCNPADTLRHRLEVAIQRGGLLRAEAEAIQAAARRTGAYHWSPPDAGVCRVVDGLAHRLDRIKALGNGQVPLAAAAAWIMLSESLPSWLNREIQ